MRLSEVEKFIADLRNKVGNLEVAAALGPEFTGIAEAEIDSLTPEMIRVLNAQDDGPYPGRCFVQIG